VLSLHQPVKCLYRGLTFDIITFPSTTLVLLLQRVIGLSTTCHGVTEVELRGPFRNAACPTYFLRLCCASSRACASSGGTTTASAVRFESDNKESKKSIFLESVLFLYDYSRNEQACQVNTPSVSVLRHRLSPQLLRYLVKSHQHPD